MFFFCVFLALASTDACCGGTAARGNALLALSNLARADVNKASLSPVVPDISCVRCLLLTSLLVLLGRNREIS
eukprot:2242976-Rhodomonas_salina.1